MTDKIKAKRKLFNFDFDKEGARVDLVSKAQGGSACGYSVILTKAVNTLPNVEQDIDVKKALEQITVTMSMQEFLRKFFDLWYDEAELLTKLMGFETEYEAYERESKDSDGEYSHSKYLEERVSQFKLMKSMNAGEVDIIKASQLNEILAMQEKLETALVSHETTLKETQMKDLEVAKAQILDLEKATKEKDEQLAALQSELAIFKAAKEKAEYDAFAAQLKDVVAEDKFEAVVKGLYALHKVDAEAAATSIDVLKSSKVAANAVVADSDLTKEQGHNDQIDVQKAKSVAMVEFLNKAAKA